MILASDPKPTKKDASDLFRLPGSTESQVKFVDSKPGVKMDEGGINNRSEANVGVEPKIGGCKTPKMDGKSIKSY